MVKAFIGFNTIGKTLLLVGDDECNIQNLKNIAKKADIAIQETDITEEDVIKIMQDNSYLDKLVQEIE